ncbi:MAG: hypothetical protein JWQ90_4801 [Hydrocarboniphaga sp.]|uniref:S8 family serine peptidase n=1 Tax=Hydrocarboniphaga sp. TaxID=2033016 RepID=UPI0026061410|nr:S8 family serine peptidase [Hydrocarboniphaga sp.]MDB5972351.1 hypothetical protein [Hydrocarboniphaga sp.]
MNHEFNRGLRAITAPIALALGLALTASAHAQATDGPAATMQAGAAAQIAVLQQIKTSKTAQQDKIGSRLYLALLKQRGDARLASLTEFQFLTTGKDGRTPVDILLSRKDGATALLQKLAALDAELLSSKEGAYRDGLISARLRLADLESLAAMSQISRIRESVGAVTHAINVSEGVQTHGADDALATYGATGAGVKLCALSDGVNSLATSIASGDLPAVDVLPGQAGDGDEGTAMLEILHDMAPSATLGFASAFNGEGQFAQNIRDLATDGCNVIVDDVIYYDESPFQDGPVAQAVNDVTAAGVLYFSSAGNENNKADGNSGTWEGDFHASAAVNPAPLTGIGPLHDFGDGGVSIPITDSGSASVLLWAESYDLSGGVASTDYDLYLLNSSMTSVVNASTDHQNGSGGDDIPYEYIGSGSSGQRLVVNRVAAGTTSSVPMFNLIVFRGQLTQSLATTGATRGHSAAAAAFSTAATPAGASWDGITPDGPNPGLFTSVNASESFTSDGPRRIILSPTGVELTPGNRTSTGGVLRQKPDITAADGVSTSAPGFDPFYGTSAAAPHAAAIAGLLKSELPALAPADIRNLLISTAIDIEVPGVDVSTGAGIVMPVPALQAGGAIPQPYLSAGSAKFTQVSGDGDAFIEPNETWSISVALTNIGGATAKNIKGTLSTVTPKAKITTAVSPYANLKATKTGKNTTPFVFKLPPSFPCGGTIAFSLSVSYNSGASPQSFPFSTETGGTGTAKNFVYSGSPVAIPDAGAAVTAPINVSGFSGTVSDVNLTIAGSSCNTDIGSTTVGIDHSFVGDLEISLIAPNGSSAKLIDNAGGSGNNFCQTVLDDQGGGPGIQSIVSSSAPFTGSFTPANPLAALNGSTGNGTWALQAKDTAGADTGSIRAFKIRLTGPKVCNVPTP